MRSMLLERMGAFGVRYAEIGFAGANQFVADADRGAGRRWMPERCGWPCSAERADAARRSRSGRM